MQRCVSSRGGVWSPSASVASALRASKCDALTLKSPMRVRGLRTAVCMVRDMLMPLGHAKVHVTSTTSHDPLDGVSGRLTGAATALGTQSSTVVQCVGFATRTSTVISTACTMSSTGCSMSSAMVTIPLIGGVGSAHQRAG
jgi:hypothetical protein